MRYILYIRKSTEDKNKQIQSLDDQIQFGEKLAQDRGYTIVDTIVESKSAKKPGRPGFAQLMDKIEKNEADGIICWKLDRLSRNPLDSGKIQWMLQSGNLKQIDTSDRNYYPEDHALLMNVEFGMSNQYVRDLGKNVSRGMQSKVDKGIKPGPAPLGYINDPGGRTGERHIFKEPEQFNNLQKIFKMAASGKYSINQLFLYSESNMNFTTWKGGKLSRSRFYGVMKNPFYYGYFEYKGQLYKGIHDPMINKSEFDKIQKILSNGNRKSDTYKNSINQKTAYINERECYRGIFHCKNCGCQMVFDKKKKKLKDGGFRTYKYYRCSGHNPKIVCSYQYVREEKIEQQLLQLFGDISIPANIVEWYLEGQSKIKDDLTEDNIKEDRKIRELITKKNIKIDRLIMSLSDEDDDMIRNRYRKNIKTIQEEIIDLKEKKRTLDEFFTEKKQAEIDFFKRFQEIYKHFENADIIERSNILRNLGSNFFFRPLKAYY